MLIPRIKPKHTLKPLHHVFTVYRGYHETARFRGSQRRLKSFRVAYHSDHDHVRVLTHHVLQRLKKRLRVHAYFPLAYKRLVVPVQVFDGVFDRDNAAFVVVIDVIDHGRDGGGFSGAHGPHDQHQTALFERYFFQNRGKPEAGKIRDLVRDHAYHHGQFSFLIKGVNAETAHAFLLNREVHGLVAFELVFLIRIEERLHHGFQKRVGRLGDGQKHQLPPYE